MEDPERLDVGLPDVAIFRFEADGGDHRHVIPLVMRFNDRLTLLRAPCDTPWANRSAVPDTVARAADEAGIAIATEPWSTLTALQRFALVKLGRPREGGRSFLPALVEFGLV